jgi:Leucine-rich repeat (LRR) protein
LKNSTQLELLDLTDCNRISDAGLAHLQGLTKLRNLSLCPRITDAGMQHLAGLTNMVAISFQNCSVTEESVTEESFSALAGMTKLKELDLYRTRVGDNALLAIADAKEMSKLKLRDSAITTRGIVEHIGNFPNLISLDLSETSIQDAALVEIGKLAKLQDLNLWRSRVTDRGIEALTKLPLKRLNLDDTSIGDGAIPSVSQIKSLEFLHLGKTAITDASLQELRNLSNVKDLILTNTDLSQPAVDELRRSLPQASIQYSSPRPESR